MTCVSCIGSPFWKHRVGLHNGGRVMAYIPLVNTIIRTDEARIYMGRKAERDNNRSPVSVMLNQFKPDHISLWIDVNVVQ